MPGFRFRVSEGADQPPAAEMLPVAQGEPLSADELARLISRLPALEGEAGDVVPFRLPAETLPPPRPGQTITQTFPPAEAPVVEPPPVGALKVLRYSPEGAVPLAPFLSLTFNQPMVPLGTLAQLRALPIPVRLSPEPEGSWRWVGTKTLMFEPVTRFPMATQYTVEVPAGTVSATGGRLANPVSWSFSTPPPTLTHYAPSGGPHVRDPLFFIAFDQRIAPAEVLETVRVQAGGRPIAVRRATEAEMSADEDVSQMATQAGEGRWLAFRTTEMLPYNATVTVDIGPGTPSAEGPLATAQTQSYTFTTYGPLQVLEGRCGYGNECPPLAPWWIRFSNPLDEAAFDPAQVTIAPELEEVDISASGNGVQIRGFSKGRTTYRVTLHKGIRDIFGQELEADATLTFEVGSARSVLVGPNQQFVVLDPAAAPTLSVYSINLPTLRVQAWAVRPEDWSAYREWRIQVSRTDTPPNPPGRRVLDTKVRPGGDADELVETSIALDKALTQGKGHVIVVIEPEAGLIAALRRWERPQPVRLWVQSSAIALDAYVDGQEMLAWANRLADGAPLPDVQVQLYPAGSKNTTDRTGLATLPLMAGRDDADPFLVGRLGDDVALLPASGDYRVWRAWLPSAPSDETRWYVFDDRQMYRPGEEVHLKGWVRDAKVQRGSETLGLPQSKQVMMEVFDSQGNKVHSATLALGGLGGFDTAFTLPETMNLGYAQVQLQLLGAGGSTSHSIQVQEFRRPEFEVKASASQGPHFVGGSAEVSVEAAYYAGGALPNAETDWTVYTSPTNYRPPKWDDFSFGFWVPWWRLGPYGDEDAAGTTKTLSGLTDAAGVHRLRLDFDSVNPPRPTSVRAEGTVMDVNRQAWTASTDLLVHPADLYVGLRSERMFVERGKPLPMDVIVTDLDGAAVPGVSVSVRAVRLHWTYAKGRWQEEERDEQVYTLTSSEQPERVVLSTPQGGTYRITATLRDAQGRKNQSEITRWVSGGLRPQANRVEQEEVLLIPDKAEYQPGDVAEILVQAPFAPAEGLLTLRRDGLAHSERFSIAEGSTTLRVPITEAYMPSLNVQVDLVGSAARLNSAGEADASLPSRPAYAKGALNLDVPPYARTLHLTVTPREAELEPGAETVVDVQLRDAAGKPVSGAELAVAVVDEAVLALTGYQLADPVAVFYPARPEGVGDYAMRRYVLLVDPTHLAEQAGTAVEQEAVMRMAMPAAAAPQATMVMEAMDGALGASPEEAGAPIRLRSDFDPLAAFAPTVSTDADGSASVPVKLPDNLTRYRVMVVAVAGETHYGKGEASLTARLPLMARPSPPRFLNFGDVFELPVVLQNQTDQPLEVQVAVRAANLALPNGAGQRVTVAARDRVELRFAATTLSAGTARAQIAAAAGAWADAAAISLPVYTPATTEAFAVYGTVDEGAIAQPVIAPTGVFTQFGGLEISTSSTALQALSDAVLYLTSYPYECSEQLASRVLAVAALRDVLSAFNAAGLPDSETLVKAVQRDLERLAALQNGDGGYPIWKRGDESWPFYSIHVAHAFARAREKDFAVSQEAVARSLSYLREIESHYPRWYSQDVRNTLTSYALYVRALLGDRDPARARRLVADPGPEKLQPEAVGWLLSVLADDAGSQAERDTLLRFLGNRVVETAGAANFSTSYREEDGYLLLASNRRADGVILDALMQATPQSDLIPKVVQGLLAHRKQGRWGNTQENVFILLAMDRYFNTYEAQTPDFIARAWLGEQYVGGFTFKGRTTDYQTVQVPMAYLAEQPGDLVLSKEGPGRLYYRLGLRYAPTDLRLPPEDQGFTVQRVYEAVDDPLDVRQDDQGVWRIKAGARVRVRLTMVAPTRRYHVALADPLPAGLEPMNPALAVTGSIPQDPADTSSGGFWWWRRTWYEHQNLRDQRAEAFASLLWEGIHTYTYVARATTPGTFIAPPAKAEEMYAPEVFGRSGTDRVIVE
jgi:hypothetical protein